MKSLMLVKFLYIYKVMFAINELVYEYSMHTKLYMNTLSFSMHQQSVICSAPRYILGKKQNHFIVSLANLYITLYLSGYVVLVSLNGYIRI